MDKSNWTLQNDVAMDAETAQKVARIACALKSLSIYASMVIDRNDCPEDLQKLVDDGVNAIGQVFVQN